MNMLVIDQHALNILDSAVIEENWFDEFNIPKNTEGLRRINFQDIVYLLSENADLDSRLLVVKIGSTGVFSGEAKTTIFERIIRVALRHFDRNITLPIQWQPYHEGSLLSVYAERFSRKNLRRIYFDQAPASTTHIFAFAVTDAPISLKQVPEDIGAYEKALEGFLEALIQEPSVLQPVGNFGILLSEPLGFQLTTSGSLEEWYERKLSAEQARFVNQPHDRPIRLRGVAGTGKTQAMTVKCLRDLYSDDDKGGDKTIAFLTHSSALAHEVVRGMFHALDPSERWNQLKTALGRPKLWIGTLYELAQEQLGYEKKGLNPLSLDGRDGRELQRSLIDEAIEKVLREPRIVLGILKECSDLADRLSELNLRKSLIEDLMNEFGCVLDAENIRKGTAGSDNYVRASRESWQMQLPTQAHRRVVLEIHDSYLELLRKERLLSMDQMIADFGRYLTTWEWDQLRERDGFDLIFVDEYHYFTRVEAMILQSLFAQRAEQSGRWPLIMAYDLKQSTSDVSLGGGLDRFRNPGVGESVPVNLNQVFRSTPQIASFLSDIDASYPAMDMEGEFNTYNAHSSKDDGDIPILLEFNNNENLLDTILNQANKRAKQLHGGGRQVAVLCLNEELFDVYRSAGRAKDKIVAVTSRDDLRELRYAKSKCVFSMPEYVAGLQFDTVFLIHADQTDLADEYLSQGARRRYVSRAYLGASRAVQKLIVACSKERKGPSQILEAPLRNGNLIRQK
ncbi:UvrD-helicase domain-containing protein [Methylomonas sp. MS20]|uniref:UvrD-helicase domain-containing protein n=1 Tax=unclassified Methylomonas TaxID=2608980 RepID=UPI0028A3F319|nr:UvrD-helicase domain-containing protein [Methylomonas sp. MV1]MDT4328279.1 UvrD-helicase domain-containing protein [Methylomonas sp. MV1]